MKAIIPKESELKKLPLALLGIPISNLTISQIVEAFLEKCHTNKMEKKTSYLTTLKGNFIAKSYGWFPSIIDNEEQLSILRNSDLNFSSDNFLIGLGYLLGSNLTSSYTSYDLLIALCQSLGDHQKGIFILGGIEKETKIAAIALHDKFNKLRLVGIATPPVFVHGEDLINSKERDDLLIEQIHSSNADVLMINLGDDKGDFWLDRVKHRLRIPMIVNVNHALNEIGKKESPNQELTWMQKLGLTHPTQEIGLKEKKRFCLLDQIKLFWISIPLVVYHSISRFVSHLFYDKKNIKNHFNNRLFLSKNRSIAVITLPKIIDTTNVNLLEQRIEEAANHDTLIFDFRKVCHIQPEGFYLLLKAWLQSNKQNKEIYGFCPTNDLLCLMKLHRTMDLFENSICHSAEILMSRLKNQERTNFYDTFTQSENLVMISLLGALNNQINYDQYLKKIIPVIGQKNCCIDFSFCTSIDNTGFAFLLNLKKYLHSQQNRLTLGSVNRKLLKQFKAASLDKFFIFECCEH